MSFSFQFDLDQVEEDADLAFSTSSLQQLSLDSDAPATSIIPHAQVPFADLLATLPPLISFTPVSIALSSPPSARQTSLLRRDLFDARFQVLSQDQDSDEDDRLTAEEKGKGKETFVDEGSDLVKGVYEGGLKTWECSLDLVDCLDGLGYGAKGGEERVRGRSVLEVGCGTALPTCSVFARLLAEIARAPSDPASPPKVTRIHLQDYNKQVLELITLPNLLLTYAHHLASRSSSITLSSAPGEIEVTPEFLESFEALLASENIELQFFEGDWSSMVVPPQAKYDLVLTSETIYSLPSLPALLSLLQSTASPTTTTLVACKRIYFGVGGGELEFRRRVEEREGKVETVWGEMEGQGTKGVGRVVMRVEWN